MTAPPSSTELPEYVEGEFTHLVEHGGESEERDGGEAPEERGEPLAADAASTTEEVEEEDELALLQGHMNALIAAGGKESSSRGFMRRLTSKLPGR